MEPLLLVALEEEVYEYPHLIEKPGLKRPEALVWLLQTLERSGWLKKK